MVPVGSAVQRDNGAVVAAVGRERFVLLSSFTTTTTPFSILVVFVVVFHVVQMPSHFYRRSAVNIHLVNLTVATPDKNAPILPVHAYCRQRFRQTKRG